MSHYANHYADHYADETEDCGDGYDDDADDYAESFEKSYYGAAKLPSGAGKQMYTNRATRIEISAMEKRFKHAQKPAKKPAKAVKNFKK